MNKAGTVQAPARYAAVCTTDKRLSQISWTNSRVRPVPLTDLTGKR
jgi:hypothetical protein